MKQRVVVFGGTGLVGASIVKMLLRNNFQVQVICRDKTEAQQKIGVSYGDLLTFKVADIFEELPYLIEGFHVVINAIGKIVEDQKGDFNDLHTKWPIMLANQVHPYQYLIHFSALGIDEARKKSQYAETKFEGDEAIIKYSKRYHIIRPSIILGKPDKFSFMLKNRLKKSSIIPLIGEGKTNFSPICVDDIAKLILILLKDQDKYESGIIEAGGEKVETLKEIIEFIATTVDKTPSFIKISFNSAIRISKILGFFGNNNLTPDKVNLLRYNSINTKKNLTIGEIVGPLLDYRSYLQDTEDL